METDKIVVDFKVSVDGLSAQLAEINAELKKTEEQAVKSGKKTEESFAGVEKKTESLKTQYRRLKAELANATDPKDVERLARATGKLKDQLDDATDAAKVFASESKFEQVGNALGSIAGKLRNLDFKGAADQAQLLLGVIQSITFKDIIEGVKTFGTTLVNIGKTLLTNPIFLLAATLTAVGYAIYDVAEAWNDYNKSSEIANAYIKESNSELIKQRNNIKLNSIAIREASGELTKLEADRLRKGIETDGKLQKSKEAYISALIKLAKEQGVVLSELENGKASEKYSGDINQLLANKKFNREKLRIDQAYYYQSRVDLAEAKTEVALLEANATAQQLEAQKKANAEKLKVDKSYQQAREKILVDPTNSLSIAQEAVKAEVDLDEYKNEQFAKNSKKFTDQYIKDTKSREDAAKAEAEEAERAAQRGADQKKEAIALAYQLADVASELIKRQTDEKIAHEEESTSIEIAELDRRLRNREISQKEYDALKLKEEKKLAANLSEIKRKEFESNKQIALINIAINTAVQMSKYAGNYVAMALVAAQGIAQAAIVVSQPKPKFAKGGVDIKGKGTGTSDEIPALISNGESVITAKATKQHKALLTAMNKGIGDKYIAEYYIAPILKQQIQRVNEEKEKSFAKNIANSIVLKQHLNDINILDSLKQSRKNDKKLAEYLANAIKSNKQNLRSW